MYFEVRTALNPMAIVPAVRNAVAAIDANVPLFGIRTQTQQIDELLLQERLFAKLTTLFGFLALLLAGIGLYGVVSYGVARRTREIGIRMALGANSRDILWMVVREISQLLALGIALGVPAALLATSLAAGVLHNMLYGVTPADAVAGSIAVAVLACLSLCAAFVPARRALRVDPMQALRYE